MKTRYVVLICGTAGALTSAYFVVVVGASFSLALTVFVIEALFCLGCIFFATRIFPELNSRHLDWQIRRNPEKMRRKMQRHRYYR